MFRDYYAILDIDITASREQIVAAFKFQAKKWHPDKNPDIDTTERMQLINEAFIILNDAEARQKYDIEYKRYKDQSSRQEKAKEKPFEERKYTNDEYVPQDEILKKWMANAKKQAAELVKETIEDIRKMGGVGAKAAGKEMANYLIYLVIFSFIVMIFFAVKEGINKNNNSLKPAAADITKEIIPEAQNQITEFTSLTNEYLTKYLFNGEPTVNDEVSWSPNENEMTIFPVSANGYCYTTIDTIHYIYGNENSLRKAVVVFSTFRKDNENKREDCHACSPYVSIAVFDRSISIWKLEKFDKNFGAIGSWGYPPTTSIGKYGDEKYYIDFSTGWLGQGYLEYCIAHYDIYTSKNIFSTEPECISNTGAIGTNDYSKVIECTIEAKYIPNSNDFWGLRLTKVGLTPLSEDANSTPVDYYVDYYYDYSTSGYIEKETVNKYNDNVIFIDKVGIITKADELELQRIDITNKKYVDVQSETRIIPNPNNKITFQQKGLNSSDTTSFNTYVRFMIETKEDVDIIYDENDYDLTYAELQQLDEELHQQIVSSYMQEPGMKILAWQGTSIKEVNGRKTFNVRFTRQLQDHPLVNVEIYYFVMNQKVHLVSLSCRISEEDKWKPVLNKMLYSFKPMTNPLSGE